VTAATAGTGITATTAATVGAFILAFLTAAKAR